MPPKLLSDDGKHVVIRPLAYCREKDIEQYAAVRGFPIIPCRLCGSQPHSQRKIIKEMLRSWDRQAPGRLENIFASLRNVTPSHLADVQQFDFVALGANKAGGKPLNWLLGREE
jgi:tRNA 2-thiocytidine biosynthesis protein TtcA